MKRLAVRGAVFLLIGLLILHAMARVVETVSPDGTAYLLRIDRRNIADLLANADEAQAIAVGSSHGDDIDFSVTDYRGYQLSRAWGDVFETRYYLHYLVPKLPRLQAVFIPVSYFTFFWDNGSIDRLAVRRSHLYTAIPSGGFIPGDHWRFLEARLHLLFPVKTILREDNWKGIVDALRTGSSPPDERSASPRDCRPLETDALANHARVRAREQIAFGAAVTRRREGIGDLTYDVLSETVQWLQEQGIRVVLFTPPYPEAYTATYESESPQALSLMKENARRLREELGAEYVDFSRDAGLSRDPSAFADGDHLNACGKRLFSKQLNTVLLAANRGATKQLGEPRR